MPDQTNLYTKNPNQIVMYTTEWCPDCRRAKFFFKRKKIEVLEVDVTADKKAENFVKELNNGNRSVPTIIYPDGSMQVEHLHGGDGNKIQPELSQNFSQYK